MSDNQPIIVEQANIIYSINNKENTAAIICYNSHPKFQNYIIPRSISYQSKEYIVTRISEKSFFGLIFKSIQFASNSEIQTIEKNSFNFQLESLTIPSKLINLEEGWCNNTSNLTKINVMPNNPRYRSIDDKIIIGKTSIEQTNYDRLVFCARDIKSITIPNFIEHIDPYTFSDCKNLQKIELPNDSKLQSIGRSAFSCSPITSITIPSKLIDLKEWWCYATSNLIRVDVSPKNPRYRSIDEKFIVGKTSINQTNYDRFIFCARDVRNITIPSYIKHIDPHAFCNCKNLQKIKFAND